MSEFKVGDRVQCEDVGLTGELTLDAIYEVAEYIEDTDCIRLSAVSGRWSIDRFVLVENGRQFKPGDKVHVLDESGMPLTVSKGSVLTVVNVNSDDHVSFVECGGTWGVSRFELVDEKDSTVYPEPEVEDPRIAKWEHIKATLCDEIRAACDGQGWDACEDGIESFCNQVGVEFTSVMVKRRAVIYLDLSPDTYEAQNELLRQLCPERGDGVEWREAHIADESEGETEWGTYPRNDDTDRMHLSVSS